MVTAAVDKWTSALSKDFGDFRFNYAANSCFPGEPRLNETHHNPLLFISVSITLGYFKYLGYEVDFSVADSFEAIPLFPNNRVLPQRPLPMISGRKQPRRF